MKPSAFIFMAGVFLISGSAWSRPVDLSAPGTQLGAAGSKGYLEVWKEVDGLGLQLGSSYLPFRYKFTTDPRVSGAMGPGFYVPMFEARSVMVREREMKANLPCGKVLYFWQDAYDPAKWQTPDKEWTGTVHDQDFTVTRDDGWVIGYHQGRLSSVTADDRHIFKWNYQGELPSSIEKDGATVLTIQPNGSGLIGSIVDSAKNYAMTYEKRPMTEVVNGIVLIKDLPLALSSFKTPDGKTASFSFDMSQDRVPGLTVTDSGGQATSYTWNPTNSYIASEDGPGGKWTYTVGQVTQEFGVPPLSRTRSDGKTEGISIDTKSGTYTRLGLDGVKTVTQVFESPGPLYQKVKEVQEVSGGVTNTLTRAAYDDSGRLLRETKGEYIHTFIYDKAGNLTGQKWNITQARVDRLAAREKYLLKSIADATDPLTKSNDAFYLAVFYLQDVGDTQKALSMIPQITDPGLVYGIRSEALSFMSDLTPEQKRQAYQQLLADFPDKQKLIEPILSSIR